MKITRLCCHRLLDGDRKAHALQTTQEITGDVGFVEVVQVEIAEFVIRDSLLCERGLHRRSATETAMRPSRFRVRQKVVPSCGAGRICGARSASHRGSRPPSLRFATMLVADSARPRSTIFILGGAPKAHVICGERVLSSVVKGLPSVVKGFSQFRSHFDVRRSTSGCGPCHRKSIPELLVRCSIICK